MYLFQEYVFHNKETDYFSTSALKSAQSHMSLSISTASNHSVASGYYSSLLLCWELEAIRIVL